MVGRDREPVPIHCVEEAGRMSDKRYYATLAAIVAVVALICGYSIDTIVHALQPFLGFLLP